MFWKIHLIKLKSIFKKIRIASDHAGFDIKEIIKAYLIKNNFSIIDLGPNERKSVDYPDYAKKVSLRIKSKKNDVGILVCGSGTGMAISANKFREVRAAVCYNKASTRLSRQHNNANIIALGSRIANKNNIIQMVKIFLNTRFEGGRHLRRIKKI